MYKFEDITFKTNIAPSEGLMIFDKTSDFAQSEEFIVINDLLIFLNEEKREEFYLLHDYVIWHGKKRIFKGQVISISKSELIKYWIQCNNTNDFRPLRIIALIDPDYLILINDEGTCFLYK